MSENLLLRPLKILECSEYSVRLKQIFLFNTIVILYNHKSYIK